MTRRALVVAAVMLFGACSGSGSDPILMDQSGQVDSVADRVEAPDQRDTDPEDLVVPQEVFPTPDLMVDVGDDVVCVPDCAGRECGDDGCGGVCGECLNMCDPGCEGQDSYPDPALCDQTTGICAQVCCPDCCGKTCGEDGCGGSCGACGDLQLCDMGLCVCEFELCGDACCSDGEVCFEAGCCQPDCQGLACGSDGCGGSCGECANGFECADGTECVCGFEGCGEDCCGGGQVCTADGCCSPQCDGKACGADGCGFECGKCQGNTVCSDDQCVCAFASCGDLCCGDGEVCFEGACCTPSCAGAECGSDGCGGSCGECLADELCVGNSVCACKYVPCGDGCCAAGQVCADGLCCDPFCGDAECGDDGCGGSCGECDAGCTCGGGSCLGSCGECQPDCAGKSCGWDGCGGSCGTCTGNTQCNIKTWACDPGKCQLPTSFAGDSFKMNSLKAGENGHEGEAVDVDNDPASCAPANMCSGGRDNSFGALMKSLAPALGGTEPLMDAVETGDIVMVVELIDPVLDGSTFLANIYRAKPVLPKSQCDFQTQTCDYLVNPGSFVPETCLSITAFDNVQAKGNVITAGGPQYAFEFPFVLALTGGQEVVLPATNAKMVSTLTFDEQGKIVAMEGIIGCAVTKVAIIDMVDQIPADALPVSKDLIMAVLNMVVVADIDADGDGVKESVSTGMKFTSIPAHLTGLGE
jgi:hypothetical protein